MNRQTRLRGLQTHNMERTSGGRKRFKTLRLDGLELDGRVSSGSLHVDTVRAAAMKRCADEYLRETLGGVYVCQV